jgi:hypothetical protein
VIPVFELVYELRISFSFACLFFCELSAAHKIQTCG